MYVHWKCLEETEEENWIDEAELGVRLLYVHPFVLFEFCIINSEGFKNEEWHHHLTCCLRTDTVPGTSSSMEGVTFTTFHSITVRPASLHWTDHPGECAHHWLNSDIHVGSSI